jgi:hypothetical protein
MPFKRVIRLLGCAVLAACLVLGWHLCRAENRPGASELAVHEWGTFTSIAGCDGQAVDWQPLASPSDLPGFVEHFAGVGFKDQLRGSIRMETPVLYFYAPHKLTVSVRVAFRKGILTEWYPHASHVEPMSLPRGSSLYTNNFDQGSITWNPVELDPAQSAPDFPREARDSRYYAARETASTPVRVNAPAGEEEEKFLFYRGVSALKAPISATQTASGKLVVKNLGQEPIPTVILFERYGDKIRYRIGGAVKSELSLDQPDFSVAPGALDRDLVKILVGQGLYPDEARAMVKTWRDSWFEEGSRLMYVVPSEFVNSILALQINPAPTRTARVFIGRLELITPETEKAVETALQSHDNATIGKYGRFYEPILEEMIRSSDKNRAHALEGLSRAYYQSRSLN